MNEHRQEYPLALMCRVLQVAHAGFYAWLQCPVSDRAKDDSRLLELIRNSYVASHGVYGARRVFGDLRRGGRDLWLASCGATHAAPQDQGRTWLQEASFNCRAPLHHRAQSPAARVHGGRAQQSLGHRHHLHPDLARLAVSGGGARPLRPQGRGMVNESHLGQGVGPGRAADGGVAP